MRAPSKHEQPELFDPTPDPSRASASGLPEGLVYRPDFLTEVEERDLLARIRDLPLAEARYKEFTARRRIASFGAGYDFGTNAPLPAPPLPPFLHPLRSRVAEWSGIPLEDLRQCTVAEYAPGTPLGWHRDVPLFGVVVGVSLGSPCRMRLRPYPHRKHAGLRSLVLVLEPRSAYVIREEARWRWQHAISPTKALRHSITFRTMLGKPPGAAG
ncbi:MAG TPA: alpha-ketoglutarate-dependent dioxygenase AlkB [Candidatus Binatia bacterium]|nr:alpha-ketoglutarate-dependent dioxygenase AlkB [Candidatus Binatia bacterium]